MEENPKMLIPVVKIIPGVSILWKSNGIYGKGINHFMSMRTYIVDDGDVHLRWIANPYNIDADEPNLQDEQVVSLAYLGEGRLCSSLFSR